MKQKHIVIDARIRRASTGRPVDRLLEYLPNLDTENRYTILIEPSDDWKPPSRKFKTATCKYRQFSFNPLQQLAYSWQLYKLRPDLVHFTLTGQQPLFYFGKQVTFTHDLTMLKYVRAGRLPEWLHKIRMRGYRLLLWQGHKKAMKIFVPTEYVRDAVTKYHLFTGRKVVVTLEASEPPLPGRAQPPEVAPEEFIMYVGSAFPHKNLDRLIEAFEVLKEHHPNLKLVLVGKMEYHAKQLRRWAKKRLYADDVVFTGFVPDEQLKWLYTHAVAYLFPSLSEGFGLPGLEAMVHGCPVVSSNATCLPEVYGDAAVYFDPENITDMAEKINQVLASPKLREDLVAKGKQQASQFSWRRMAEQTVAVYREVLS
ncbi:MAG TPA: glycosyltransferase family 1 protein [Candidatus Limnocylindrales bacterium]|nr:glycosyltransferase family 1 protein [Candidatus Limnocylindrales bacterium]